MCPTRPVPGPPCAPRVLIVDDDAEVRDALHEVLTAFGYATATCANANEALDYLRATSPPAVILLDLEMPVMDGWSFYRAVRRDPALRAIPIVLLSAHGGPTRAAPYVGVAAAIAKPVEPETLLATIGRCVRPREGERNAS